MSIPFKKAALSVKSLHNLNEIRENDGKFLLQRIPGHCMDEG